MHNINNLRRHQLLCMKLAEWKKRKW